MKAHLKTQSLYRTMRRLGVTSVIAVASFAAAPLVAGATTPLDAAPTLVSVSGTNGNVTVSWTNDAADATSIDVILYDVNGNVIEDDSLSPTTTSDTFVDVADGGGDSVDVVATTPGGPLDAGGSNAFDVFNGTVIFDNAPTITSVSGTNGNVMVSWTNDAADATSIDVILYDVNGNVIEDDSLSPTTTSDTFVDVADGGGDSVDVVATTPGGPLDAGGSNAFDVFNGTVIFDNAPTITSVSGANGNVTVSWTNDAADATSIDVILYDVNGNVIEDDSLSPTTTSDTFVDVADGGGDSVDVVATTPGGPLDAGGSNTFDVFNGTVIFDNAPTITSLSGSNGNVTISWTNDAADATSIDVILYDVNGNVIEGDSLSPTTSSDTFVGVADGQGYTIDVVATTPGGSLDSGSSQSFDVTSGVFSTDTAPNIVSVTGTNGTVTVTWTNATNDETGFDVILYDANGNVIADDSLTGVATTDALANVADADDLSISVVVHTPFGDFTASSWSFSVSDGSVVINQLPVDPPTTPITVVDPSTVTVSAIDGGLGGWIISWPELSSAPTNGYYVVSTDQGDSCTAQPTGVAGTNLTCTLAARSDGTTTLTGLSVEFQPFLIEYALASGSSTRVFHTNRTPSDTGFSSSVTPINTPVGTHAIGPLHPHSDGALWLESSVAALVLAAGTLFALRRRAAQPQGDYQD